jgi:hypothetical protein
VVEHVIVTVLDHPLWAVADHRFDVVRGVSNEVGHGALTGLQTSGRSGHQVVIN